MKITTALTLPFLCLSLIIPPSAFGQARWNKLNSRTSSLSDRKANEQDHVGSVHVTVTGVELWEKVAPSLKTKFEINEEKALEKVIPTTQFRESQLVDAMKVALKIAGPTVASEEVVTSAVDAVGAVTDTSNETVKTTSPDAPSLGGADDLGFKDKATVQAQLSEKGSDIGRDPFVEYRNAAALFQSVSLLNQSIDLATSRTNMTPYLVTMQITLMPYTRTQAYDTYSNVSFFPPTSASTSKPTSPKEPISDETLPRILAATPLPVIIPILVTDNLEAATQKSSANIVRQFSLAAAAMTASVGGDVKLDTFRQNIDKLLGEDLNSLITVARVSDNLFRVRLGANHQASSQYAMVPQAHTLALLMLVPDDMAKSADPAERLMQYQSYTSMRNANFGYEATERPASEVLWKAIKPLKTYARLNILEDKVVPSFLGTLIASTLKVPTDRNQFLGELYLAVIHDDYNRFIEILDMYSVPVKNRKFTSNRNFKLTNADQRVRTIAPGLWSDLNRIWVGSKYSKGQFEVPKYEAPTKAKTVWPDEAQTPVLVDDGVVMSVELVGGSNVKPSNLIAELTIPPKAESEGDTKLVFTQRGAEAKSDGTLRFTFPSIEGSGLGTLYPHASPMKINLALSEVKVEEISDTKTQEVKTSKGTFNIATYWNRTKDVIVAPVFDVRAPSHHILSDPSGVGSMQLIITNTTEATYFLEIAGCDIDAIEGDALADAPDQGDYKIKGSGRATLKLSNLSQFSPVTVISKKQVKQTVGNQTNEYRVPAGSLITRRVEKVSSVKTGNLSTLGASNITIEIADKEAKIEPAKDDPAKEGAKGE